MRPSGALCAQIGRASNLAAALLLHSLRSPTSLSAFPALHRAPSPLPAAAGPSPASMRCPAPLIALLLLGCACSLAGARQLRLSTGLDSGTAGGQQARPTSPCPLEDGVPGEGVHGRGVGGRARGQTAAAAAAAFEQPRDVAQRRRGGARGRGGCALVGAGAAARGVRVGVGGVATRGARGIVGAAGLWGCWWTLGVDEARGAWLVRISGKRWAVEQREGGLLAVAAAQSWTAASRLTLADAHTFSPRDPANPGAQLPSPRS